MHRGVERAIRRDRFGVVANRFCCGHRVGPYTSGVVMNEPGTEPTIAEGMTLATLWADSGALHVCAAEELAQRARTGMPPPRAPIAEDAGLAATNVPDWMA